MEYFSVEMLVDCVNLSMTFVDNVEKEEGREREPLGEGTPGERGA